MRTKRPQITSGRVWRLLVRIYGAGVIDVIKRRRIGSGLSLRDAIASLWRDSR